MAHELLSTFLKAAHEAADLADTIIQKAFRGNFSVEYKADTSPVTEVDVNCEKAIRHYLENRFPAHGFYGEETGQSDKPSDYLWLVDPIDGTKAFVRGYPIFSVQIALMYQGNLILGVSSAPCFGEGERAWASQDQGAYLQVGKHPIETLKVGSISSLNKATLSTGNLASLAKSTAWGNLGKLIPQLHRIRGYGDFWHYHYLASNKIDAVIESDVNILDIAALAVIVREAGGIFTDLSGNDLNLKTTSVLASTPTLHPLFLNQIAYGQETV
jgi:histidinol-phosphatase